MSDTRTVPQGNGAEPQAATTTTLPDDILSRIVSETERQIRVQQARPSPVHLRTWEEIERFADKAARSGMVPKDYVNKPDAIVIAVQMGSELGLPPVQALQNIAVVNGRPSVYGDGLPGLCRSSGMCSYIKEWHEGDGDTLTYWCEAKRKDQAEPIRYSFSVADAKKAGLWGKAGPWAQYPPRMLQMRARGFCLRDAFPDVLRGLISAEEAEDIPLDMGRPVPPVATDQPFTQTVTHPLPTDTPKAGAFDDLPPDWRDYMDKLKVKLDMARDEAEVTRFGKLNSVTHGLAKGPPGVPKMIEELLADAYERVRVKVPDMDDDGSDAAEPGSLDEVLPPELRAKPETP